MKSLGLLSNPEFSKPWYDSHAPHRGPQLPPRIVNALTTSTSTLTMSCTTPSEAFIHRDVVESPREESFYSTRERDYTLAEDASTLCPGPSRISTYALENPPSTLCTSSQPHSEPTNTKPKPKPKNSFIRQLQPMLVLENSGSVARDHLASERTFLAYVRTSLAVASTGVGE